MKKSVAITTIVTLHAAVIGMLLVQAGCTESDTQPAKASTSVEEVNGSAPATSPNLVVSQPAPQEGSGDLRVAPTRPAWSMTNKKGEEIVPANKESDANPDLKSVDEPIKPIVPDNSIKYTVKKGDNLSGIAKKHNVALSEILKANSMTSASNIKVGQELIIPASKGAVVVEPAVPVQQVEAKEVKTDAMEVYIVKKGDSLGRIAKKYNTNVNQLMSINSLKNHNIMIGQKLNVPQGSAKPAAAADVSNKAVAPVAKAPAATPAEGEVSYTIKSGDTIGAIAVKYGTTVSAICDKNGISDPRKLKIGQVLIIKSKRAGEVKAAAAPVAPTAPATPAVPAAPVVVEKETATPAAPVAPAPTVPATPVAPAPAPAADNIPVVEL